MRRRWKTPLQIELGAIAVRARVAEKYARDDGLPHVDALVRDIEQRLEVVKGYLRS